MHQAASMIRLPKNRKACDRCHDQKLSCQRQDNGSTCARCARAGATCCFTPSATHRTKAESSKRRSRKIYQPLSGNAKTSGAHSASRSVPDGVSRSEEVPCEGHNISSRVRRAPEPAHQAVSVRTAAGLGREQIEHEVQGSSDYELPQTQETCLDLPDGSHARTLSQVTPYNDTFLDREPVRFADFDTTPAVLTPQSDANDAPNLVQEETFRGRNDQSLLTSPVKSCAGLASLRTCEPQHVFAPNFDTSTWLEEMTSSNADLLRRFNAISMPEDSVHSEPHIRAAPLEEMLMAMQRALDCMDKGVTGVLESCKAPLLSLPPSPASGSGANMICWEYAPRPAACALDPASMMLLFSCQIRMLDSFERSFERIDDQTQDQEGSDPLISSIGFNIGSFPLSKTLEIAMACTLLEQYVHRLRKINSKVPKLPDVLSNAHLAGVDRSLHQIRAGTFQVVEDHGTEMLHRLAALRCRLQELA